MTVVKHACVGERFVTVVKHDCMGPVVGGL